jgi:SAM-dependent methyltransferase
VSSSPGDSATLKHVDRPQVWGPDSAYAHPVQKARAETIRRALPEGTRTVLDVGCGDGTVTNRLGDHFEVVGLDLSRTALQHVTVPTVVGSATDLPFEDRSFDAVVLSEVLEHLDADTYVRARGEAARVAARTIVVTVPNREVLRDSAVRCPRCRTLFSPWQHTRSFSPRTFRDLFDGFAVDLVEQTGPNKPRVSRGEALVRSVATPARGLWFPAICPSCGLEGEGPPPAPRSTYRHPPDSGVSRYATVALELSRRAARRTLRPRARPVWLLGRWHRTAT